MSLLVLEGVTRHRRQGTHEHTVLHNVSLHVASGELLAIWGARRSGRSTLLRIAAGIEPADEGVVRFAGRPLRGRGGDDALGHGIGYCPRGMAGQEAREVLDELMLAQLARGTSRSASREGARAALERVGAGHCAAYGAHEVDGADAVRVAIARALVLSPSLLVLDQPTKGVDLLERDSVLRLLRSLADDGTAVLMSAGEAAALSGADRALSLADGRLLGDVQPELADVVPLRRQTSA